MVGPPAMHGASEERKTGRWLALVARFALAPTANASEPAPTSISRTATTKRLGIYTEHPPHHQDTEPPVRYLCPPPLATLVAGGRTSRWGSGSLACHSLGGSHGEVRGISLVFLRSGVKRGIAFHIKPLAVWAWRPGKAERKKKKKKKK
jgi:hypothetical protein